MGDLPNWDKKRERGLMVLVKLYELRYDTLWTGEITCCIGLNLLSVMEALPQCSFSTQLFLPFSSLLSALFLLMTDTRFFG